MPASDAALLDRWIAYRDAEAFAEIVSLHSSMVYATSKRILRNATEAEDVAQECFTALVQISQTDNKVRKSLGAWLHILATHRSLNRLRTETRRRGREERFAEGNGDRHSQDPDDIQAHIDEAIADLPDKLRIPLVVHFLEGESHQHIAETLRIPRTTVTSRIARGVEKVRERLKKRGIAITVAALASILTIESAEAAPAALTAALGKLAISGGGMIVSRTTTQVAPWASKFITIGGAVVMWKNILLGAGAVALILAVLYAGKSQSGRSETPEEKQPVVTAVSEKDPPAVTPPVDHNEGKAAQPVKTPAEQLDEPHPEEEPTQEELNNVIGKALEALFKRAQDAQPKDGETKLKPYGPDDIPLDNGTHYFLLAVELYPEVDRGWMHARWEEIAANGWIEDPALRALFEECRDAFDAIREGLEVGNAQLPPFRWPDEQLTYCQTFRDLAKVMAMEAQMYAADGDHEAAFDDYATLLEFATESSRGGSLINGMVGFEMAERGIEPLLETLNREQASAQEYRQLIERVGDVDNRAYAAWEMANTEREDLGEGLESALSETDDIKAVILNATADPNNEMHNLVASMTDEEVKAIFLDTVEDLQIYIDNYFSVPFYEAQETDMTEFIGDNPVSLWLLPAFEKIKLRETTVHANNRGAMLTAAIELYRVENDSPPPSLDTLVPDYISELPEDPFSGDSFAYDSTDSGYVLYSTGPDMVDDGGVEGTQDGGDMVFHR
ncbi:sigma-70 family RNA polymerase sigma factor [Candidatus Hydrogenedentota bacterium]